VTTDLSFPHDWRAEILTAPPLIAPARQFTYPRPVPGEEDALARGALQLLVHPGKNDGVPHSCVGDSTRMGEEKNDGVPHPCVVPPLAGTRTGGMNNVSPFLATCALGFTDPSMPTGVYSCPNPRELCAVAGGYAYILDTATPEHSTHIALRPVVEVLPLPDHALLLFAGFHSILAWGREGLAWQTARLSWEGLRLTGVRTTAEDTPHGAPTLTGLGWNMHTDKEVEFAVDLRTGAHTGGGFT
jgi:hypothetical protein